MILFSPDGTKYAFTGKEAALEFLRNRPDGGKGFKTLEEFIKDTKAKNQAYEAHRREYREVNPIKEA